MANVRLSHFPTMPQIGGIGASAVTWDDIQAGASRLIRPGGSDPTWRTWDFGLGGPAFSVLGFSLNDYVDFWVQTSHSQKLLSPLDFHIHYTIPSDSAADKIKFQIDVIAAGITSYFAVPSGSPFSGEVTLDGTESAKHNYLEIGHIPGVNSTVSSAYGIQMKRVAASSDDYAGEVYLLFADSHYQRDTSGSFSEDSKQ